MKEIFTIKEFDNYLLENKAVAVMFMADTNPPSKMIGPKFEAMAEQYKNIGFAKVNVDAANELAEKLQIGAIPTFYFYLKGEKVDELVGASEQILNEKLLKHNK